MRSNSKHVLHVILSFSFSLRLFSDLLRWLERWARRSRHATILLKLFLCSILDWLSTACIQIRHTVQSNWKWTQQDWIVSILKVQRMSRGWSSTCTKSTQISTFLIRRKYGKQYTYQQDTNYSDTLGSMESTSARQRLRPICRHAYTHTESIQRNGRSRENEGTRNYRMDIPILPHLLRQDHICL